MTNHSEGTKDDVIIVKLEQEDFLENAENNNIVEKLKFEIFQRDREIFQRDKENAESKAALKELQHKNEKLELEKENFENKFQMEKLKSENILLKAELNMKIFSDDKHRIEEHLQSMTKENTTLHEIKTKLEAEAVILNNNFQKLQGKYDKLQKEKIDLERLYNGCKEKLEKEKTDFENLSRKYKLEKENVLKRKKAGEELMKNAEKVLRKARQGNKSLIIRMF